MKPGDARMSLNAEKVGLPIGPAAVIATVMELVRPGHVQSMDRLLATSSEARPTYPEVGATLRGEHPEGYRHDTYQSQLGNGRTVFRRASSGLQTWKSHEVPGVNVLPHNTAIEPGGTVVVTLGTPWLAIAAPCRIVGIVDESDRWGFAYGTLPGHPEQGEEFFIVSIHDDDAVRFTISAFSRPGDAVTRIAGPIARAVQAAGTTGYLKALQRFVNLPG
jgi:uncharacterized protein (UPF0548 family)